MRLLILAGGFGTRLKDAVSHVPKALAPVSGRPFLEWQIKHWIANGISDFTFLLHYEANQIINFLKNEKFNILKGCRVDWVVEPTPLGTGGAVANAIKKTGLENKFLLVNADTWLGGGFGELSSTQVPTLAAVNLPDAKRYGQVYFDQEGWVTGFEEKSLVAQPGWVNAGLYHLDAYLFDGWDGSPFSFEKKMLPDLLRSKSLRVVPLKEDFIDIGIPTDYFRFCKWMLDGSLERL